MFFSDRCNVEKLKVMSELSYLKQTYKKQNKKKPIQNLMQLV